jgi:hypothetical protein
MLQRKLITVCTALLVFITTHAQIGPSRIFALITKPAHYVKSNQLGEADDAIKTENQVAQARADNQKGSKVLANITVVLTTLTMYS